MRNDTEAFVGLGLARWAVHFYMRKLVDFKKDNKGKNFVVETDEVILEYIIADLEDARERLGRLERKYL